MAQPEHIVVLVTVTEAAASEALARTLVDEGLAACVQVIPGGTAVYRWEGKTQVEHMCQLVIKSRRTAWPQLQQRIVELHSDQVPEMLALPVQDGLPAYLRWIDEVVR